MISNLEIKNDISMIAEDLNELALAVGIYEEPTVLQRGLLKRAIVQGWELGMKHSRGIAAVLCLEERQNLRRRT